MEITIKSLKFDADKKLIAFVEKKVDRLSKFLAGSEAVAEVVLKLDCNPLCLFSVLRHGIGGELRKIDSIYGLHRSDE